MKTLITAAIALTLAAILGALILAAVFAASLIHPLAPIALLLGAVVAILVYVEVARP